MPHLPRRCPSSRLGPGPGWRRRRTPTPCTLSREVAWKVRLFPGSSRDARPVEGVLGSGAGAGLCSAGEGLGGLWPSPTPLREPWEPVVWRPLSTAGSPRPVQSWVVRSENLHWASAVGRPCRTLGRQCGPGWPWSTGCERATPGRGPGGFPGDGGPICPELWPLACVHGVLRLRLQAPGPTAPSLHPAPSGRHRTRPH